MEKENREIAGRDSGMGSGKDGCEVIERIEVGERSPFSSL